MEKNAKEDKVQDTTSDIADQRYSIKEITDTIKEDVMENRKTVANMDPIAELEDTLFEKSKKTLSEQVLDFFNERGTAAYVIAFALPIPCAISSSIPFFDNSTSQTTSLYALFPRSLKKVSMMI